MSRLSQGNFIANYFLPQGGVYATAKLEAITTILGSCIAVCLWDEKRRVGGMNHIVLPSTKSPEETSARFGNVAMPKLLDAVLKAGGVQRDIKAKIFGGARGLMGRETVFNVGEQNYKIAEEFLHHYGIPILVAEVGGSQGRKIVFLPETGEVQVMVLHKVIEGDEIKE